MPGLTEQQVRSVLVALDSAAKWSGQYADREVMGQYHRGSVDAYQTAIEMLCDEANIDESEVATRCNADSAAQ